MKNVARNILCQLLRSSQWHSWRWLSCLIRWTLWFQIWRTGIWRVNSYIAAIKTQQPVYKFSRKKVFMGNWIPLEMSLVGIKEVAIWDQMLMNCSSISYCFSWLLTCTNLLSSAHAPMSTCTVVCQVWKRGIPLWKGLFPNSKLHFWTQMNHSNVHLRISNRVSSEMVHIFPKSQPLSS
jgi:hypothetical protein